MLQGDVNSGTPLSSCRSRLTVLLGGGFSAPTVISTIMDQVHGHPSFGGLGYTSFVAFPAAPIKGGQPLPWQGIANIALYSYQHARKTNTIFFPFLVIHHSQSGALGKLTTP